MAQQVFSVKVDGQVVARFRADLAQAAAAVEVRGDDGWVPTRHQTASGRHDPARLAELILLDDPDTTAGDAFEVFADREKVGAGAVSFLESAAAAVELGTICHGEDDANDPNARRIRIYWQHCAIWCDDGHNTDHYRERTGISLEDARKAAPVTWAGPEWDWRAAE